MPNAQVTVEFVNQPREGKKKGSIKTKELGYLGVWPDKLAQFTKGQSYEVEYKENGQYKDFVKIVASAAPAPKANGASHTGGGANGTQSRDMFLMAVVGRAMASGKFTADDVRNLTFEAADAWDRVQGRKILPDGTPDDDAGIPY